MAALLFGIMTAVASLSMGVVAADSPSLEGTLQADAVSSPGTGGLQGPGQIISGILASGVDSQYVYLPNMYSPALNQAGVSPFYERSPAPMGVADYGLIDSSGIVIPYHYNTTSFLGTVMFEDLKLFPSTAQDGGNVAIQLSAVLSGVTVQGSGGNVFWIKNVMLYSPGTGQMQFISNIWDFSTPSLSFPAGTLLDGNGDMLAGSLYYYAGPVVQASTESESTMDLMVQSTMVDGNNAVQFQYAQASSKDTVGTPITYDTVVFNSHGSGSSSSANAASFTVSGNSRSPANYLNDVELTVTGPGMGSTATMLVVNGQLTLKYMTAAGSYEKLPSAFNYGSNTGETVQGLSAWWSSQMKPLVHLTQGPSLLVAMWGSTVSHSGAVNLQGSISPSNAFVLVNIGGTFDPSAAAWAPVNTNGSYSYSLPGRVEYTGQVMLSNYNSQAFTLYANETTEEENGTGQSHGGGGGGGEETENQWVNVTLDFNASTGIYTPIYAYDNSQVASLATAPASGTVHDQYVIGNSTYRGLNPAFSRLNSFMEPAFHGIMLYNTSVHVTVESPPAFHFNHPSFEYASLNAMNLPYSNTLDMLFLDTSNVTMRGGNGITGWFPLLMEQSPAAPVMFVNSHDFLVSGNSFSSMGISLLIYSTGGQEANGTVWGNTFSNDFILQSTFSKSILHGTGSTGLAVYSSGNMIYNNYFSPPIGAVSPLADPFDAGSSVMYQNAWNLPQKANLSYTMQVNGYNLTGSIVSCGYQGGNYWGLDINEIPYRSGGGIGIGGDSIPLIPPSYNVSFMASGYPGGSAWGVTLDNRLTHGSSADSASFRVLNGTYHYRVLKDASYGVTPSAGWVTVNGSDVDIQLSFDLIVHNVTFNALNIPHGAEWSLTGNGMAVNSTSPSIVIPMQNGSYNFIATSGAYSTVATREAVLVNGEDQVVNLTFYRDIHRVVFIADKYPAGSVWTLDLNGRTYASTDNSLALPVANGTYTYSITAPRGYESTPGSGTIGIMGQNETVEFSMAPTGYEVSFHYAGMPAGTPWSVTFDGIVQNATSDNTTFTACSGTHEYVVAVPPGYEASSSSGTVYVSASSVDVAIHASPIPDNARGYAILAIGIAAGTAVGIVTMLLAYRRT